MKMFVQINTLFGTFFFVLYFQLRTSNTTRQEISFATHSISLKPKQDPVAVIRTFCDMHGCPEKFLSMLQVVYNDMMRRYKDLPQWQKQIVRTLGQHVYRLDTPLMLY